MAEDQDEQVREGTSASKGEPKGMGVMRIGKGNQCPFMSDSHAEGGRLHKHCSAKKVQWTKPRQGRRCSQNVEEEARIGTAKGHSAPSSSVHERKKIGDSRAVQQLHDCQGEKIASQMQSKRPMRRKRGVGGKERMEDGG